MCLKLLDDASSLNLGSMVQCGHNLSGRCTRVGNLHVCFMTGQLVLLLVGGSSFAMLVTYLC